MAEIELMRCAQPYWYARGGMDTLMPAGTILPVGHPDIIELYWEPYEIEQLPTTTTSSSKRTQRKG